MTNLAFALARAELIRTLTAYNGITTSDGLDNGTTLIDSNLIGKDSQKIVEKTILIMSGDAEWEDKGATLFDTESGKITLQGTGFSAQIKRGTIFRVLNISSVEIDVEAINAKVGTNADAAGTTTLFARLRQIVDDYLAKLAGEAVVEGTVSANWNTSTGTSGEAGEDLLGGASAEGAIGAAATKYKLHSLLLDVLALTDGAKIDVKLFMKINGNERKVYDQEFTIPTTAAGETPPPDTLGLWIVNGTVAIHDELRVEVYSDTNESVPIAFTYVLEAM